MTQTKKNLIIIASVLNIIVAIAMVVMGILTQINVVDIISALRQIVPEFEILGISSLSILIYSIMIAGILVSASILLLFSISSGGKNFYNRRPLYITGIILTAICGFVSISAILLYISLGIGDEKYATYNENSSVKTVQNSQAQTSAKDEAFQKKLAELRKLKEEGVISEEEFKALLMKML